MVILIFISVVVIIYIVYSAKKNASKSKQDVVKSVSVIYDIIKLDKNKTVSCSNDKKIKLTEEKKRLANIAMLFSLAVVLFEKKALNIGMADIIRWFLVLAREKGFSEHELLAIKSYLLEPRATSKRIKYLEFSKELKTVTKLFVDNFQETMNIDDKLNELSINVFFHDVDIVLNEFLPTEDFPEKFSELT